MPKKIDVSVSSLIDLKAELNRKSEQKQRQRAAQKTDFKGDDFDFLKNIAASKKKPLRDKGKEIHKASEKNEKQSKRKEVNETKAEEERRLRLSKNSLEAKAKLYERLAKGEKIFGDHESSEENGRCLVNFNRKMEEDDEVNNSDADEDCGVQNEEEKWVDYVDSLGRTRRCMQKDLHKFKEADSRLQRETTAEENVNEPKPSTSEEEVVKGPVHYQHLSHDEAREHGVAYMKFSTDETLRQEQMKNLDALRKQTIESRARSEKLKEARRQKMAARLAKVRERKKMRLEEGQEDPLLASDSEEEEEEGNNKLEDVARIPLPGEIEGKKEVEGSLEKERKDLEEERDRKRKAYIRPWDKDKKTDVARNLGGKKETGPT